MHKTLIFGYDLHKHFMKLRATLNPEVWAIFTTFYIYNVILKMIVLTRRLMGGGCSEVNIYD